jgi:hypothetical protein
MTDEEALRKARLLKALVERGSTEGERAAARSVLDRMVAKHPSIRAQLDAPEPSDAPPPPPPWGGAWGAPPPRPAASGFKPSGKAEPPKPAGTPGFMGNVWEFLQGAAASLREGMTLRERVRDITAVETSVNTRTFSMRLSIPVRDLEELLDELGPEMDEALATVVASIFRDEFVAVLASMDTEGGDE